MLPHSLYLHLKPQVLKHHLMLPHSLYLHLKPQVSLYQMTFIFPYIPVHYV